MLCAERCTTILSGWRLWRNRADLAGWDVRDKKSPIPSQHARVLGAMSNLTGTPRASPTLEIAPDRKKQLTDMLKEINRGKW